MRCPVLNEGTYLAGLRFVRWCRSAVLKWVWGYQGGALAYGWEAYEGGAALRSLSTATSVPLSQYRCLSTVASVPLPQYRYLSTATSVPLPQYRSSLSRHGLCRYGSSHSKAYTVSVLRCYYGDCLLYTSDAADDM
eukprot:386019-Rhodomonas_salina.2